MGTETENILEVLKKYWGYPGFLPLQEEAMGCVLGGQDSVVVLPTGGGKSLCFQAPAMVLSGLALVVSPLISLMKDQVDALEDAGIPAARLDSTQSPEGQSAILSEILGGRLKLLYVSPERLMQKRFLALLRQCRVSLVAVDEAHCISVWGHDFRPEYRQLGVLKDVLPGVAIHAYTATATQKVRGDIAQQLRLNDPRLLVGSFDRPNLVYKVRRRDGALRQVCDVLDRHPEESGIVYCIRRADVEDLCARLTAKGYRAAPYHAGMSDADRKQNQEAFIEERVLTIVATVAFGMGIDKSNVRYVVHAGMPKSLEHYQQETGRAGRDGLEAECCLLYSGGDYGVWKSILEDTPPEARDAAFTKLTRMYDYCTGATCRRTVLLDYFGQELAKDNCEACDVCLGELDYVADPLVTAQKILSCVARLKEQFGAEYTTDVLLGSKAERILRNRHDRLSTYGLLADQKKRTVRDWVEQLVGQDCLRKSEDYGVLSLTEKGWRVLRGQETPRLLKPAERKPERAAGPRDSWEGVDRELFEALRRLRRQVAAEKNVPPYIVFGDATLRDMARRRPSTPVAFLRVHGVGQKKCEDYAAVFLPAIAEHCRANSLAQDVEPPPQTRASLPGAEAESDTLSPIKQEAFGLFAKRLPIDQVAEALNRARSTTIQYLVEYIAWEQVHSPSPWVDEETFFRVAAAAQELGAERLKPIFDRFGGSVPYESIRVSLACLRNRGA